jgi:hypothetical protein
LALTDKICVMPGASGLYHQPVAGGLGHPWATYMSHKLFQFLACLRVAQGAGSSSKPSTAKKKKKNYTGEVGIFSRI